MSELRFKSISELKVHFLISANVSIGEASFVQVVEHAVIARASEDAYASVQIGVLRGDTYIVNDKIAKQAGALVDELERFVESGDHDGLLTLDLILISDGTYRLYGVPMDGLSADGGEVDPFEKDSSSLDGVLKEIRS